MGASLLTTCAHYSTVLVDQERLHQLKEDAKWGPSLKGQIEAVRELGTLGKAALPSLEEVLQVSVREEIKRCCVAAIEKLGRDSIARNSGTEKRAPKGKKGRRKARNSAR